MKKSTSQTSAAPSEAISALYSDDFNRALHKSSEDLALDPSAASSWKAHAIASHRLENLDYALSSLKRAVLLTPLDAETVAVLGRLLAGVAHRAGPQYSARAIVIDPSFAKAYSTLAEANKNLGVTDRDCLYPIELGFKRAATIQPKSLSRLFDLGNCLFENGKFFDALSVFNTALAYFPAQADVLTNRGNALKDLHLVHASIANYERALRLKPNRSELHGNLGVALEELHKFDEAIESFDNAIRANPGNVDASWNKALVLLLTGRFETGWRYYESRWARTETITQKMAISNSATLWDGTLPISNKTLAIHSEQGFGDTIQFCRLIPRIADFDTRIVSVVEKDLVALLEYSFPNICFFEKGGAAPEYDLHVPLMSVPRALKCNLLEPTDPEPYLRVPPSYQRRWSAIHAPSGRLRIGLAWSGNPRHRNDRNRSMALKTLMQYLPTGPEYFRLQKDIRSSDLNAVNDSEIVDLSHELHNFADTAALCELMDVVVSVDTSVAHLAAALGRKCLIMLPFLPDWRWQLDRSDCPWYPTVELFRQTMDRSWDDVARRVGHRILDLAWGNR